MSTRVLGPFMAKGHIVTALRRLGIGAMALAALALASRVAVAQQGVGTVTGKVVNAGSQQPIGGAYIGVDGGQGTLTSEDGRYTLHLSVGSHKLTIRRIGFAQRSDTVEVTAGGQVARDFALSEQALALEEVVVTGQAGAARRREVGNSVAQINTADVVAPPVNVEDLMQSRATGLNISQASGGAGGGSYIRLRGNISMSQSNFPLIYVDGVRMRNDPYPPNEAPLSGRGNSSGLAANPLNSINPDDIDRVEIIKGPAATTLYGTEASAGVIQIFTKQGTRGTAPQWTMSATYSMDHTLKFGTDSLPYMRFELGPGWLRNALGQNYDVSVRGGSGDMQYFLAGQYKNADAPLPNDHIGTYGLRGNLSFQASRALNIEWNTSLNRQDIQNTAQTNSNVAFPINVYRGDRNYLNSLAPDSMAMLLDYKLNTQINHLVSGATVRFQPMANFTHRLTVGYDFSFLDQRQMMPFGFIQFTPGMVQDDRWSNSILTVDYAANMGFNLLGSKNTFSAGAQLIQNETADVLGWSQGFAGPGEPTVSGGSSQVAQENRMKIVTAGFFFENRIAVADNLFVTAGLRVDGNSAFGKNLGLQPYPKISASYVLSDAGFWPHSLGTVKLRAAWGQAGRAPGAFDAVKTYNAVRYGGTSAFQPLNLGDPNLGPERSSEVELGFDAAFLKNRLSTEVTYFDRHTTEALFPVTQPPSTGDWNAQLENVGKMSSSGWEVNVRTTMIENATWGLDLGASLATTHSKVVDLGGASMFQVGDGPAYAIEGEPAPVLRAWHVTNPDELADPVMEMYNYGPTYPTKIIGQNLELRFKGVTLSARGEFQGGFWMQNRLEEGDVGRNVVWPICSPEYQQIADQGAQSLTAAQRAHCVAKFSISSSNIQPGDFWKLRNVSVRVPLNFLPQRPSMTLSAANAMKWMKMKYFDSEMSGQRAQLDPVRVIRDMVPPPATYSVTFRVNF